MKPKVRLKRGYRWKLLWGSPLILNSVVKMKNKKVSRRNFIGLVSGIAAMPSLALSEERTNGKNIRGRVIQDPLNKQEVNGFINIPTVWGEQLKVSDSLGRVTIGLVEAIKKYTDTLCFALFFKQ